jgi:hypothetical protein
LEIKENQIMKNSQDNEILAEVRPGRRLRSAIYGERITVSLRLKPELHERMMALCNKLETPANTYISALIESDLKKRRS